jgi:hypothetical protein
MTPSLAVRGKIWAQQISITSQQGGGVVKILREVWNRVANDLACVA